MHPEPRGNSQPHPLLGPCGRVYHVDSCAGIVSKLAPVGKRATSSRRTQARAQGSRHCTGQVTRAARFPSVELAHRRGRGVRDRACARSGPRGRDWHSGGGAAGARANVNARACPAACRALGVAGCLHASSKPTVPLPTSAVASWGGENSGTAALVSHGGAWRRHPRVRRLRNVLYTRWMSGIAPNRGEDNTLW